jgi:hypothetical protein
VSFLIPFVKGDGEPQFLPSIHNFYAGNPGTENASMMERAGNLTGPAPGTAFCIHDHFTVLHFLVL